ncbi:hypothetical protein HBI25_156170 [Parastagonospora nodorum]|nr:hypothetical protein HBH51_180870 [Parastagonospora nodorum]KAH4930088.1 hypothetical protein HBI79_117820 [Parastagonospora nodorum]KAH4982017.1 hypothetical protein HBI76_162830 [Parastagonospora nodorum]KAH5023662.1 hypothetical protein HBI75_153500 [Parastagonospora nodorum]KAH5291514.1 hypothetical protein HBI11_199200 [Parastagonospora nodorum]
MNVSEMHGSLSALMDLKSLGRLTLARCDGIYDFFAHLHLNSRAGCALPNLQHLDPQATECDNMSSEQVFEMGTGCLDTVLSSVHLKSAHLLGTAMGNMTDYVFEISLSNTSLVSFSAHIRKKLPIDGFFEINDVNEVGDALCKAVRGCPNLRVLG